MMKEKLSEYINLKEQAMFTSKRNRQLKYGYRDNIRDQIIRPKTTSNFFSSRKQAKHRREVKSSKNSRQRMKVDKQLLVLLNYLFLVYYPISNPKCSCKEKRTVPPAK